MSHIFMALKIKRLSKLSGERVLTRRVCALVTAPSVSAPLVRHVMTSQVPATELTLMDFRYKYYFGGELNSDRCRLMGTGVCRRMSACEGSTCKLHNNTSKVCYKKRLLFVKEALFVFSWRYKMSPFH